MAGLLLMKDVVVEKEIQECNSSPCLNGGTCVEQIDTYLCNCAKGFYGNDCENGLLRLICSYSSFVRS